MAKDNKMEEKANIAKLAEDCVRDKNRYLQERIRSRSVDDVLCSVTRERERVSEEINSLEFALGMENPPWSEKHGELMKKQLAAMLEYRIALGERIKDIIDNTQG